MLTTIENFTNPFSLETDQLFNLVTKVVVPDQVKKDLMEQTKIGQDLFGVFVKDRIQTGKVNIWEPMRKRKLQTWMMRILEKLPAIAADLTTNVPVVSNQEKTTNVPVVSSEELITNVSVVSNEELTTKVSMTMSIVDGMTEVQLLDKPEWIKNCSELSDHFTHRIFEKYRGSDKIRLIFDRYDFRCPLKRRLV